MKRLMSVRSVVLLSTISVIPSAHAQFDLVPPARTFEEERQQAEQQHEQMVLQSGGLLDDAEMAAYVNRVGQKVVRNSDMPDKPFTFSVLDSPVVNAWTVGGGYVYITRGMLAIMNSEAELAAVLGHEVGHVTGRHTSRRETKIRWKQYETGLLALLTGNLYLAGAKGLFDTTMLLSYSRKQENAADRLGFQTIKKAGYDLDGMTDMLSDLQRFVRLQSTIAGQDLEHQVPAWLQDHPQTDDRIRRSAAEAALARASSADQTEDYSQQFLSTIDGVMYGEDPAQGTVRNGVFWHTGMAFAFDVAEGIQLQNSPFAVIGVMGEELAMIFAGANWPFGLSLEDYASNLWADATSGVLGPIDRFEETEINGMPALIADKDLNVGLTVNIRTFIYRLNRETVMHMSFLSTGEVSAIGAGVTESMGRSFRRLSEDDIAAIKARRVKIVEVGPQDTLAGMADRMAFHEYQLARFKALNGIETLAELKSAGRVKIVVLDE